MEQYDKLCKLVERYHPSKNIEILHRAYEVAKNAHQNQRRKSGEPYIIHPLEVACILAELRLDRESIAAALLHDVIEDTNVSREEIEEIFGTEILFLVEGVTKIENISGNISKGEIKVESFRKLILAMSKDIRVVIIKLADRLHNMRTLEFQSMEKQKKIARETIEIYAPIAQRLGISILSDELEDLALRYLIPEKYREIKEALVRSDEKRNRLWNQITQELEQILSENKIRADIVPRLKHMFSIYRKLELTDDSMAADDLYDIYNIDIIVNSREECYLVLGHVHQKYYPVPGRFKDYIALPKTNMYQALHTTLISKSFGKFEVQIKTKEMYNTSNYGILAHWKYKSHIIGQKEKSEWLEQILEWQLEYENNQEFIEMVKQDFDLLKKDIYCFTKDGEVKQLPKGAIVVDFAYLIHSDVGNKLDRVLVNGIEKTPTYELKNGDQVEIILSEKMQHSHKEWLNYVKTSNARTKIRKWIREYNNIYKNK